MIGLSRFLILLATWIGVASSMGYIGGRHQKKASGDWPETFPEEPDDFEFGCRRCCPCVCPSASSAAPPTPNAPTPTVAVQSSAAPASTTVVTTPRVTTPVPTTTSVPTTTPRVTTTPVPTTTPRITTTSIPTTTPRVTTTPVPTTTPRVTTTPVPTTTPRVTTTPIPTTTPRVTTTPIPTTTPRVTTPVATSSSTVAPTSSLSSVDPIVIALQQDIVEGENPITDLPEAGTTFWIRTPTPPNKPAEVVPGSGSYSLGPPVVATVKVIDPFAPDAALDTLDARAGDSDDFDFNIKPVGKPQAPRAVIDPDA